MRRQDGGGECADAALERAAAGQSPAPALALLSAYVLFAAVLTPFAGAAAVRNAQG